MVMFIRDWVSASGSLSTPSKIWKNSITVFAASSCSGVKVSDGCGFEGEGTGGEEEGVVVVRGGCCGAVPQDSESLPPEPGCCPPHEDSNKTTATATAAAPPK